MNDMENHSTLFLGSFDGGDHTISNLKYESDKYNCGAGLFGVNCGEVKNLTVENAEVTVTDGTSLAIGGVVGYNMGSVDHVTLKGNSVITGNNCTGGIVGGNNNSVTNCSAENVTVIVIGDNEFEENHIVQADVAECGGLVIGGGFGGTIDNCSASGTVKAEGNEPVGLGGIGGCLEMRIPLPTAPLMSQLKRKWRPCDRRSLWLRRHSLQSRRMPGNRRIFHEKLSVRN